MAEIVYIGLGSNLGDRERFLQEAVARLDAIEGLEVIARSAIYETVPQEMAEAAPAFLNMVVKADYDLAPEALYSALEEIEQKLGRTNKGERMSRTIDLDLLLFGDRRVNTALLKIPHPRLQKRAFVLIPLVQIDPDIVHPATGKPLAKYITAANRASVRLFKDHVAREV